MHNECHDDDGWWPGELTKDISGVRNRYQNVIHCRLERDKAEALSQQKEAMNRAFRVQMSKLLKEKEDLIRKCSQPQSASKPPVTTTSECQKLAHEIAVLRGEKKKLEEQLQVINFLKMEKGVVGAIIIGPFQVWKESEQYRFENMRSLLDDKTRELTLLQKQLKQQIARLVSRSIPRRDIKS